MDARTKRLKGTCEYDRSIVQMVSCICLEERQKTLAMLIQVWSVFATDGHHHIQVTTWALYCQAFIPRSIIEFSLDLRCAHLLPSFLLDNAGTE